MLGKCFSRLWTFQFNIDKFFADSFLSSVYWTYFHQSRMYRRIATQLLCLNWLCLNLVCYTPLHSLLGPFLHHWTVSVLAKLVLLCLICVTHGVNYLMLFHIRSAPFHNFSHRHCAAGGPEKQHNIAMWTMWTSLEMSLADQCLRDTLLTSSHGMNTDRQLLQQLNLLQGSRILHH